MAGDPYFDKVVLLLNCNGANGSTTLTDSSTSGKTATRVGTPTISTAQSVYDGASLLVDGSAGSYFTFADHADFEFGTGDFTIEFRVRFTSTAAQQAVLAKSAAAAFGPFVFYAASGGALAFYSSSNGSSWDIANAVTIGTLSANTWYAVAVTRSNYTFRTFFDGVKISEWSNFTSLYNGTDLVYIGSYGGNSSYSMQSGYIDELRITKGLAIYTADYTLAAAKFPDYQPYIAGNITESLAITNWRVNAINALDGSSAGTTTSGEAGTTYNILCTTTDPCNIEIAAKFDYPWTASRVVALNGYCIPSNPQTTPKLYKATSIGSAPNQTGGSEPTWPGSGTVADGDITWTFIADLPDRPLALGPVIPS